MSLARPTLDGRARGESRLTIVRHHRVYADQERPLYRLGVAASVFTDQVEMLRALGLGPLTVTEGLERLSEGAPGHWVAMTFDDGYADNVERALPILTRSRARATFFLTAGLIDARRAPWWDRVAHALVNAPAGTFDWVWEDGRLQLELAQRGRRRSLDMVLRQLRVGPAEQEARIASLEAALGVVSEAPCELATWEQADRLVAAGMEVGAHTLTHPFLDRLDPAEQSREIGGSVARIAERLGVRPDGIAYPGGAFDAGSIAAARAAGLHYAVTTRAGVNRSGAPRFELRRRGFDEGMCLAPNGHFSRRLARAELEGAFDGLRGARSGASA